MIIGITGLPCSGSDSFGRLLVDKGFIWLSYSDLLREEIRRENREVTRQAMQDLANKIRRENGTGELSKRLLSKMEKDKNYVVGTIRNPGEINELRKRKDFVLIALKADNTIRFQRMKKRSREKDPTSFDEFLKLEEVELGGGQEDSGLQIKRTMDMADHVIMNEGTFEELEIKAQEFLEKLRK